MRSALAGLGLAGLLCLPCLLIGGVVSLGLIGGAVGAFATNPLVQLAGVVLLASGTALFWRARRRAACAVDCAPDAAGRDEELAQIGRRTRFER